MKGERTEREKRVKGEVKENEKREWKKRERRVKAELKGSERRENRERKESGAGRDETKRVYELRAQRAWMRRR